MTTHGNLHTVTSEDAHDAATRDREATALGILDVAVKEAIELMRLGASGKAEWRLARASMAANRILGTHGAPVRPGVRWVTSGSTLPIHVCGWECRPNADGCCWAGKRLPHTYRHGVCTWCHHVEGATA